MKKILLAIGAIVAIVAAPASAATLIHSYDFNGTAVTDSVGTANGILVGSATVSGGVLRTSGGYAQLNRKIIPSSGAFSLYFEYDANPTQPTAIVELISQGQSGNGFYVGRVGNSIRLTDNYLNGVAPFQSGRRNFLLASGGGNGVKVFVDGTQVFSSPSDLTALGAVGDNTRFGAQFSFFGEQYYGTLDNVRVFSGIASYAEASASVVPEPITWAMMLVGFGIVGGAVRYRRRTTKLGFA